jgi:hypothetical protein
MIKNPYDWKEMKVIMSKQQMTSRDCLQMLSEIREDDERAEAQEAEACSHDGENSF